MIHEQEDNHEDEQQYVRVSELFNTQKLIEVKKSKSIFFFAT